MITSLTSSEIEGRIVMRPRNRFVELAQSAVQGRWTQERIALELMKENSEGSFRQTNAE